MPENEVNEAKETPRKPTAARSGLVARELVLTQKTVLGGRTRKAGTVLGRVMVPADFDFGKGKLPEGMNWADGVEQAAREDLVSRLGQGVFDFTLREG